MLISYSKCIKQIGLRLKTYKNIELNSLPVYDDRYIKIKVRTYGDKVYTNFCGWNVSEDVGVEYEPFYNHFYWFFTCLWEQGLSTSMFRQIYLQNCKHADNTLFDENLFDSHEN